MMKQIEIIRVEKISILNWNKRKRIIFECNFDADGRYSKESGKYTE